MTELDEAVNLLAAPVIYQHKIGDRVFTVELESRLEQLEGAITNTLRSTGTSNAMKNTRSVLNSDALETFMRIANHIANWCISIGIRPGNEPARNLRAWAAVVGEANEYKLGKMLEWATLIDAQFQPTRTATINTPCPVCGATSWVDDDGETHLHPLERSYVEGELLTTVKARCKARECGASWEGADAVAELGEELGEAQHAV